MMGMMSHTFITADSARETIHGRASGSWSLLLLNVEPWRPLKDHALSARQNRLVNQTMVLHH
jgi:hypothetical protein